MKARILPVAQGNFLVQHNRRVLLDRHRFPRQRGLFDLEIDAFHEAHIGGDIVAGFQKNDVARNKLPGGNHDLVSVADDLGIGGGHLLQGGNGLFGLRLLNDPDHGIEGDDEDDRDCIDILAQKE